MKSHCVHGEPATIHCGYCAKDRELELLRTAISQAADKLRDTYAELEQTRAELEQARNTTNRASEFKVKLYPFTFFERHNARFIPGDVTDYHYEPFDPRRYSEAGWLKLRRALDPGAERKVGDTVKLRTPTAEMPAGIWRLVEKFQ